MASAGDAEQLRERFVERVDAWRGAFLDVRRDRVALPDGSRADREYIVHTGAVMVVPLLDRDRVRLPDGTEGMREYIRHPGAVAVVALFDDGSVLLERQFRYPHRREFIEIPAGKLEPGEPVLACAVRELAEETGYRAREWARAGILHNAISYSTKGIEVWFARGLEAGERSLDVGEFLDVFSLSVEQVDDAARRGDITDAKTLVGLLWLANWRAGRWPLQWVTVGAAP